MTGERKIVGIWPAADLAPTVGATFSRVPEPLHEQAELSAEDGLHVPNPEIAGPEPEAMWIGFDDEPAASDGGFPWMAVLVGLIAVTWVVAVLWIASAGFSDPLPVATLPEIAASIAAPIAVLLLAWLLVERGSERSIRRHLRLLDRLRTEQRHLAERIGAMDRYWHDAQATLAHHAAAYTNQALEAGRQIDQVSQQFEGRMREAVSHAALINEQGDAARRHMESLIVALPKVDDVAQRAAETMREAGQTAYQFGGQLEARIAALRSEAQDSRKVLEDVDTSLAERIEALIAATGAAERGAVSAGERFADTLGRQREAALALMADLAGGMDGSVSTVEQRFDAARATLAKATTQQLAAMARGISDAETRAGALTAVINSAVDSSGALDAELGKLVDEVRDRVAAMVTDSDQRLATLAEAISDIQQHFVRLGDASHDNIVRVGDLGDKAATVVGLLNSVTREVDVTLPAAIGRLQQHIEQSVEQLAVLPPMVEANANGVGAALARLYECEAALEQQAGTLASIDRTATDSLSAQLEALAKVRDAIGDLVQKMASVREEAAPDMLDALARAEQAADAAAERARAAIQTVVRSAASDLETTIAEAIDRSTNDAVTQRIAGVTAAADEAVASATAASDRLMRQLITIADSSAALEARAESVLATVESHDRDTLSRQMALLTESLQSTAVDLTRILSVDVADQSWSAYLKGDRGIFARRAVRLLSASEARDILSRYQSDDDFRALVNRYIHDFEAMLRGLLDTRDGSALSVTLLSSDIGKVYVALAQAIERLRN